MMNTKVISVLTNKWFLCGVSALIGIVIILGIRFVLYTPETVHYHANFAVYVNGQKEQFKGHRYYEETAASMCSLKPVESPLERAHMHDDINSVVHVEDHLVTWGNFFQNIRWGVGDDYLKTADHVYVPSSRDKLTFILNGRKVDSISNTVIGDQSTLLISYGADSSSVIQKQYDGIKNSAKKYDLEQDPAGCSGSHRNTTVSDRLKHLL